MGLSAGDFPINLYSSDATDLADLVRSGEVKAAELLDICLERIGRYDRDLNAFVTIDPDGARSQAEEIDRAAASGVDPGPLAGVPIGVKDLEDVAGLPTGRGSLLYQDQVAQRDSTQVARLRAAGAVIVGKTASPELGTLSFTWSKAHGTTRNPWNLERTPGGSSGGSAAAVAAAMVPLSTGSDGGGSIRIPSSFSGLPGLKPTFGLIARGPGRLGSGNLSCYGPLARSVKDIARYLDQTAGAHPMDPHSLPRQGVVYENALDRKTEGLRAVWSTDLGFGLCAKEVATIARSAAERLMEAAGITEIGRPVELPEVNESWMLAEAIDCFTDLEAFWPERTDDLTPVVMLSMQIAEALTPSSAAKAQRERYELLRRVNEVLEEVDLIMTPTTPTVGFGAEGPFPSEIDSFPIKHTLLTICFTFPFNLTGHPAVTIPAGLDSEGMPVGLQIAGPRLSEPTLLSLARLFERISPWPKIAPAYL